MSKQETKMNKYAKTAGRKVNMHTYNFFIDNLIVEDDLHYEIEGAIERVTGNSITNGSIVNGKYGLSVQIKDINQLFELEDELIERFGGVYPDLNIKIEDSYFLISP